MKQVVRTFKLGKRSVRACWIGIRGNEVNWKENNESVVIEKVMGVESFFINSTLAKPMNSKEIVSFLNKNGFDASFFTEITGLIIKKAKTDLSKIIIDQVALCVINRTEISFQGCFSCFEDALHTITNAICIMRRKKLISDVYYGDVSFFYKTGDEISRMICDLNRDRLEYFRMHYTRKYIKQLPNTFFVYYRKHSKELK